MALYKRKDSRYWWLEFEFEGRRRQLSTKCRNKRDAEKFEAAYRTQLANDKVDLKPRRAKIGFDKAAADFLAASKQQQVESTYKRYLTSSKATISFFASKPIADITREHISKFVTWRSAQKKKSPSRTLKNNPKALTKKKLTPATINRELAFIRIVFNHQIDDGALLRNPVSKFKFLAENDDTFRILTPEEDKIYLMACTQPLRDVAKIILGTGLRPSEVYELKDADVNFKTGFIQVTSGKTKAARRKVPMSEDVRKVLLSRVGKAPGPFVFGGGIDGKSEMPIVKLTNAHLAAVKRSKLHPPFRLYDCRHTFATRAVEAGVDLVTLKDLLGHSRLEMVLKYAHPTEAHRVRAIGKMDEYKRHGAL